jgi:hypothetical protein
LAEEGLSAYSQRELKQLAKTFQLMGDEAVAEARSVSNALASYTAGKIKEAGYERTVSAKAVKRTVDGLRVSKTSKTGQISIGFAGQRFSGGATTQMLWRGLEFGSVRFKQFPSWSGRYGRGSRGWFIYPTLRSIQSELTQKWTDSMDKVVKNWKTNG